MACELKQMNPTKSKFCYNFTSSDCYELRTGKCSLYLSEEEAQNVSVKEKTVQEEAKVMYCRKTAKSLLAADYYNNPNDQKDSTDPIKMHPRHCGHYVFTGGQHRICIAKHLNINSIYAYMEDPKEYEELDSEINCDACRGCRGSKRKDYIKYKDLFLLIKRYLTGKSKSPDKDFIDEDYMNFKKKHETNFYE
ncbi:hypothetical protein P4594_04645 [Priestia megaterium]|uniref:hypothetical protein n=1 Tax=Priestia megaterium TaxID=1404 RepID=UPI002E1DEC4C|nr:hypothetical protein [Priestia megaterium]